MITLKSAKSVALGGMLTALSVALLAVSGFTQIANLTLDSIAGIILVIAVVELGLRNAVLVYFAVTVLSLILVPNKEPVILYSAVFGIYTLLKSIAEKIKKPVLEWVVKIVSANICLGIAGMLIYAIGLFPEGSVKLLILGILAFNLVFVLYDIALTRLIAFYIYRIRKKGI